MTDIRVILNFCSREPGKVEIRAGHVDGSRTVTKVVSAREAREMAYMLFGVALQAEKAVEWMEARVMAARET